MTDYSSSPFGAKIDLTETATQAGAGVFIYDATGTPTFLPIGTSLQVLRTNSGATALEFGSGVGLTLLKRTSLAAPATSIDCDSIAGNGYKSFKVVIGIEKNDDDGNTRAITINLNNDAGNNYTYNLLEDGVSSAAAATGSIKIGNYRNTGKPFFATFNLLNESTMSYRNVIGYGHDAGANVDYNLGGFWANSAQVTRITLNSATANMKIGSFIEVYGVS